jgi:hypothetical protein
MSAEIENVEVIQGAEYGRSTETVIYEEGTTLSEYKTNSTGSNDQKSPSEVDVNSGGRECDGMEQKGNKMPEVTDAEAYSAAETLNTGKSAKPTGRSTSHSVNQQDKEAVEVEAEFNNCHRLLMHKAVHDLKIGIEGGKVEVTKDPSLIEDGIDFSEGKTLVHQEYLKCLLREEARITESNPREELRLLQNGTTQLLYEGATSALGWLLGRHNEEMAVSLTSDEFNPMLDMAQGLWSARAMDGRMNESEEKVSNSRDVKDEAGPVLCRNRKQIEKERKRLNEFLDVFAGRRINASECIKVLRVTGACSALEWFLSGENSKLATYLVFSTSDAPEKS